MSPRSRARRIAAAFAVAALATGVLAACGGGSKPDKPAAAASPTVSPTPKPKPWTNPLTGLQNGKGKRLLVVKIDNTHPSHPQVGIQDADIGYIEEVEGGLTRVAVVFSSHLPDVVGPVRSARMTDIDLFSQYGPVAFAYSGAQPRVTSALQSSPLQLAEDGYGGGWFRGLGRYSPYNLFVHPKSVLAARPHSPKVHDVGFRFGKAVGWGNKSNGFDVYFQAAHIAWHWSTAKHRWLLSMDGAPSTVTGGGQISAANVIVQYAQVTASNLHDVNGMATPYTKTIGSGRALFYRDGKVVKGEWSRKSGTSPTVWTVGKAHKRYPMKPGKTWIVLVPSTMKVKPA